MTPDKTETCLVDNVKKVYFLFIMTEVAEYCPIVLQKYIFLITLIVHWEQCISCSTESFEHP